MMRGQLGGLIVKMFVSYTRGPVKNPLWALGLCATMHYTSCLFLSMLFKATFNVL